MTDIAYKLEKHHLYADRRALTIQAKKEYMKEGKLGREVCCIEWKATYLSGTYKFFGLSSVTMMNRDEGLQGTALSADLAEGDVVRLLKNRYTFKYLIVVDGTLHVLDPDRGESVYQYLAGNLDAHKLIARQEV